MPELLSVGLDVGTTTTQMVVSRLKIENQAGSFSVPELKIGEKQVIYQSPVQFTPMIGGELVDGERLREIVAREYERAGITREQVDTGAIIITGETSRRENAREVTAALSELAGEFVVATAGPDLESVLAARGAGAAELSERLGRPVLHMDIGGGTSNLALIEDGRIRRTGCLNVGGRLLKRGENGEICYVSPVLAGIFNGKVGDIWQDAQVDALCEILVQALEMAAGLREPGALLRQLMTHGTSWEPPEGKVVLSFSGGVADCIETVHPRNAFGDIGVALGQAIRRSALCRGEYRLAEQTIRATVIGAGCHSAQLSGSTVFHRDIAFPLKNLPVAWVAQPEETARALSRFDGPGIVYLEQPGSPTYGAVTRLADSLAAAFCGQPALVAVGQDMAKALGQALALRLPQGVLCIDGVRLRQGDYLDVAAPVGPALPVVVKTLVFDKTGGRT